MSETPGKPDSNESLHSDLEVVEGIDQFDARSAWNVLDVFSSMKSAFTLSKSSDSPKILHIKGERGVYICELEASKKIKGENIAITIDDENAIKEFTLIQNDKDAYTVAQEKEEPCEGSTSRKHVKLTAEEINDVLEDIADNAEEIEEDTDDVIVEIREETKEKLS
jgi:hypothetical protein